MDIAALNHMSNINEYLIENISTIDVNTSLYRLLNGNSIMVNNMT
jgi:hypothetical protein